MSTEKCAHKSCSCMAKEGSKFCSQQCEDQKDMTTLGCECGHPGCASAL
jgi:hypothetical protein